MAKRHALRDAAYHEAMEEIIERDFFPILHARNADKPRKQEELLESAETFVDSGTHLSLDAFAAKYTSEDTASFDAIVQKEHSVRKESNAKLYPCSASNALFFSPPTANSIEGPRGVLSITHAENVSNERMGPPPAKRLKQTETIRSDINSKAIRLSNHNLHGNPLSSALHTSSSTEVPIQGSVPQVWKLPLKAKSSSKSVVTAASSVRSTSSSVHSMRKNNPTDAALVLNSLSTAAQQFAKQHLRKRKNT